MRKLLLAAAAVAFLASPAMAEKMLSVNLSVGKPGVKSASIVNVGAVDLIAFQNRVDVYVTSTNSLIPSLTVTVPLQTITDMVFVPPSFLTVQGAGPNIVTIDYSTVPPTIMPFVPL